MTEIIPKSSLIAYKMYQFVNFCNLMKKTRNNNRIKSKMTDRQLTYQNIYPQKMNEQLLRLSEPQSKVSSQKFEPEAL